MFPCMTLFFSSGYRAYDLKHQHRRFTFSVHLPFLLPLFPIQLFIRLFFLIISPLKFS